MWSTILKRECAGSNRSEVKVVDGKVVPKKIEYTMMEK